MVGSPPRNELVSGRRLVTFPSLDDAEVTHHRRERRLTRVKTSLRARVAQEGVREQKPRRVRPRGHDPERAGGRRRVEGETRRLNGDDLLVGTDVEDEFCPWPDRPGHALVLTGQDRSIAAG